MAIFRKQNECPSDVLDWIAWYDEPGLPDETRSLIDRHAAECLACRREIAWVQDESDLQETSPDGGEEILDRVLARARGEQTVTPLRRRPRSVLQPALAAAAALILVAGLGWTLRPQAGSEGSYQTASEANEATSAANAAAHDVEVIFRDDASWSQVSGLLAELGVVDASGPSLATRGRVQLSLAAGQRVDVALNSLRESQLTLFAEPISR